MSVVTTIFFESCSKVTTIQFVHCVLTPASGIYILGSFMIQLTSGAFMKYYIHPNLVVGAGGSTEKSIQLMSAYATRASQYAYIAKSHIYPSTCRNMVVPYLMDCTCVRWPGRLFLSTRVIS